MTSVLNAIVKLPRFVKIRSTNGDEDNERPYYTRNITSVITKVIEK